MKIIIIISIAIFPFFVTGQKNDSIVYCESPDTEAKPIDGHLSISKIINEYSDYSDCFNPESSFFYNVIILNDGTVSLLNLEGIHNKESCIIINADVTKIPKWIPATKNGKPCNQKLRIRTYIDFE